jgi:hypothetical protein
VCLLQTPAGVRAGVWAVVAALMVDAIERRRRHLRRITRPRNGVLLLPRTVAIERAGALAMSVTLTSFAAGDVTPWAWAGAVGSAHPFVGTREVDGGVSLQFTVYIMHPLGVRLRVPPNEASYHPTMGVRAVSRGRLCALGAAGW